MLSGRGVADAAIEIEKIDDDEAQHSLPIQYDSNGIPLEPQPSADPHDPLNFPTWLKWSLMAILAYWSFIGTMNLIIVVGVRLDHFQVKHGLTLSSKRGPRSSNWRRTTRSASQLSHTPSTVLCLPTDSA